VTGIIAGYSYLFRWSELFLAGELFESAGLRVNTGVEMGSVLLVLEPVVPGGIGVYTSNIMNGLSSAGILHPAVSSQRPMAGLLPPVEAGKIEILETLFGSLWWPLIRSRLAEWAEEQETALIHGLSAVTQPVCARLAARLRVPYVITVHHYQKRGAIVIDPWLKAVVTVSESLREHLVNDAQVPKELVRLIPAGIEVPEELSSRPVEYMTGDENSVPLVSAFGKLVERKDFSCYLHAIRRVLDTLGRECSFVLAGDGPEEPKLRKLAKELEIDKQLTFCHGSVRYDELLRDTDVYVQCSKSEGFGTMVLQAMAHGVPVVATATGGFLSLVTDSENGYLVPVGDHEALAARIVNLLTDAQLAQSFGEAGRLVATTNFKMDRMLERTLALYAEIREHMPASAV
jgi:glycosyltransferase involved in cell wall biosynthesis